MRPPPLGLRVQVAETAEVVVEPYIGIVQDAHVAAQVQRAGVAAAVRRRRSVDAIDRVSEHLAAVAHRNGSPQLGADSVVGQQPARQGIVGKLVQPAGAPLGVSAQRQQHVAQPPRVT